MMLHNKNARCTYIHAGPDMSLSYYIMTMGVVRAGHKVC